MYWKVLERKSQSKVKVKLSAFRAMSHYSKSTRDQSHNRIESRHCFKRSKLTLHGFQNGFCVHKIQVKFEEIIKFLAGKRDVRKKLFNFSKKTRRYLAFFNNFYSMIWSKLVELKLILVSCTNGRSDSTQWFYTECILVFTKQKRVLLLISITSFTSKHNNAFIYSPVATWPSNRSYF